MPRSGTWRNNASRPLSKLARRTSHGCRSAFRTRRWSRGATRSTPRRCASWPTHRCVCLFAGSATTRRSGADCRSSATFRRSRPWVRERLPRTERRWQRPWAVVARLLERGSDNGRVSGVLQALERGPMTADQVARDCGVRVYEACALLSELEIDGLATLTGGGVY